MSRSDNPKESKASAALLRLLSLLSFLLTFGEEPPLEQQQIDRPAGDAAVGEIEDGPEEDNVTAAPDGETGRKCRIDDRKIEHIHHPSVQEWRIVEDDAVKHRVDHVADGAAQDGCQTDEYAGRRFRLLEQPAHVEDNQDDQHQTAQAEDQFAPRLTELQAEGHTVVFDKQELEPVAANMDALADRHVCLDQDLDDLVDNQQKDDKQRNPRASGDFHRMLPLVLRFDAEGSVRNQTQTLLGNQLTGFPADAIGLVLDTDQGSFQVLDELVLTGGQLAGLFLGL